ncbi:MAG: ribosome maturation factor RimM [Negativicutes bacterium]|nr:ribosome maturation factor RimM [Negativicutes bacterium]
MTEDSGSVQLVLVGRIQGSHGVRGDLSVRFFFDRPPDLAEIPLLVDGNGDWLPLTLTDIRQHGRLWLVRVKGIDKREQLQSLAGRWLYADRPLLPDPPPGRFYSSDLIGLTVEEGDVPIGVVRDVIFTGSNEVYLVELTDGGELCVPALKSVVAGICLPRRRLTIRRRNQWLDDG